MDASTARIRWRGLLTYLSRSPRRLREETRTELICCHAPWSVVEGVAPFAQPAYATSGSVEPDRDGSNISKSSVHASASKTLSKTGWWPRTFRPRGFARAGSKVR